MGPKTSALQFATRFVPDEVCKQRHRRDVNRQDTVLHHEMQVSGRSCGRRCPQHSETQAAGQSGMHIPGVPRVHLHGVCAAHNKGQGSGSSESAARQRGSVCSTLCCNRNRRGRGVVAGAVEEHRSRTALEGGGRFACAATPGQRLCTSGHWSVVWPCASSPRTSSP